MPCFNAGRRGGFDEPVTKGRQVTRGRRLRLRVFRVIVLVLGGAFFLVPIGAMFEFSTRGNHVGAPRTDRKSTRLNSSHLVISYAVFCLKKKKEQAQNV